MDISSDFSEKGLSEEVSADSVEEDGIGVRDDQLVEEVDIEHLGVSECCAERVQDEWQEGEEDLVLLEVVAALGACSGTSPREVFCVELVEEGSDLAKKAEAGGLLVEVRAMGGLHRRMWHCGTGG